MRRNIVMLAGLAAVFGLSTMVAGCSSKPSCKLLYKRYKECKKMPLTEEAFVESCKKHSDSEFAKEQIKCSAKKECSAFKKCMKQASKKASQARVKKDWKKALAKSGAKKYSDLMSICNIYKNDLSDDLKAKCKAMPAEATKALSKEIAAKRDAGKVDYKQINCYSLKRYAKKAGASQLKAAETLCKEIDLARDLKRLKDEVAKRLKKASPYLPYQCGEKYLDKYRKLGTPYVKKTIKVMINECYKKLGRYILEKKLPKQKYVCWVKSVYKGIKKYKITGPKIDELMKKAAEKCEKKKK